MLQGGQGEDYFDGGADYDIAAFVEIPPGAQIVGTYEYVGLTFTTTTQEQGGTITSTYTVYNSDTLVTETVVNVEEIWGSNYNDTMTGGVGDDNFVGARGSDTISGNAGDDTLYGSLDDDVIDAGENDGTGSDTLIFLRYNTDGNAATSDPGARGDGYDTVLGFNVENDTILFIGNEDFEPASAMITKFDESGVTGTLITYASNSSILLEGVDFDTQSDAIMFDWEYVDV